MTDNTQNNQEQEETMSIQEKIFCGLYTIDDRDTNLEFKSYFRNNLSDAKIFKDEFALLKTLLDEFPKIVPDAQFIKMYIITNRSRVSNNPNINLEDFRNGENSDPLQEFTDSVISIYNNIMAHTIESNEYFKAVEMLKMEYITEKGIQVLEEGAVIASEGLKLRGKVLSGFEDMSTHVLTNINELKRVESGSTRRGTVTFGVNDQKDGETSQLKLVTKFGIKGLDDALGGLYEGDMCSFIAPPKGFKSRIAVYILHHAVVNGVSSVMWSLENGVEGISSIIRARHFEYYYNRNVTDINQRKVIDSDMIRKDEMTPELRELERISHQDLRTNQEYGQLTLIDEDFVPETFLEVLSDAIDKYGAKLAIVDYLQLLVPTDSKKPKNQAIGDAYKESLQFCKRKKIAGLFPGQIKQETISSMTKKDGEIDLATIDLRDGGAETSEVIRTPDINIGIYGTLEGIARGDIKLLSIPSRNSKPFTPIQLYAQGGIATFTDITEMVNAQ